MFRLAVTLVVLCGLASACFHLRRRFIATWFRDGQAGPPPPLPQPSTPEPGLPAVPEVRVFLIDGLGRAAADLPVLAGFCAQGLDLEVDVGFPTVSLPVQAVLWTGRTQQQSGWLYRLKALPQPPVDSSPARAAGSLAVAEEQGFIAGSFGFGQVLVPTNDFATAAADAVAGEMPLVFVHVLAVDKAGHKGGAASAGYTQAAVAADAVLGRALAASPPGPGRRWFVLSDHGHRAGGGHGGAAPDVRLVRACVAGGLVARRGQLHLVDLSRAVADSLGLAPAAASVGRPLGFALANPAPAATLPPVPRLRFLLAIVLAAVLIGVAGRALGRRRWALSWSWLPLAWAGVALVHGGIDLSTPAVYPPLGRDLLLAAGPGFLALALLRFFVRIEDGLGQALAALGPALAGALGTLVMCGGLAALLDATAGPPLDRHATALASAFLLLAGGGALALALGTLLAAARTGLHGWGSAHMRAKR